MTDHTIDTAEKPVFYLTEEHHPESSTNLGFWLYLMSDCLMFAVLFATYGVLGRNYAAGPSPKDLFDLPLVAVIGYFASFIVLVSVLRWLVPSLDVEQKQDIGFNDVTGTGQMLATVLALVVFAPFAEEVLFRGFLYTGLRRRLTFAVSTILTSLLFGAAHLLGNEQGASLLWIAGIDTMVLSIILCVLREKTGRLWAPMLLHAVKNSVAFSLLYIFNT